MINTALVLLSAIGSANTTMDTKITSYDCRVAIFADDLSTESIAEQNFSRPVDAEGSHGGDPFVFDVGDHRVVILADGRWRGITWLHKDKTIANVVSAASDQIQGSAALIVQNPNNSKEEVHLSCEPYPGQFPTE